MTIEEMKIVITADNSDVAKKVKDLSSLIDNFKNKSSHSLVPNTTELAKYELQLNKILDKFSLQKKQKEEKLALALSQMQETKNLRMELIGNNYYREWQKIEKRVQLSSKQKTERGDLQTRHLGEKKGLSEFQLTEESQKRQKDLIENLRKKQLEMYEKMFVQQIQLDDKKTKKTIANTEKERQKKQEMYEKMFVQQIQLDDKKTKKTIANVEKERQKKQEMYEKLFIKAIELEDKKYRKEVEYAEKLAIKQREIVEKNASKQQILLERNLAKQKKENAKKEKGSLFNKALSSFSIGNLVGVGALASTGTIVVQSLKKSMKDAVDSTEFESLFQLSLGSNADEVRKWSEQVSNSLGLNANAVRKDTANIYHMIRSMNVAESSALKMAEGVTLLSKDIASFQHKDPQQVYERITAGLMGQTRGLHLMGYAITEANVKQYAYAHGITEVGKKLTEQQKVVARYLLLMEQTQQTHGNLALKLNSTANQTMMLNANMETLSRTFGGLFLPFLNKVIPYLTAFIKLLSFAVTKIKEFFGIKSSEEIAKELTKNAQLSKMIDEDLAGSSNNASDLAKNMKKANKEAKKQLASFDEINVLTKKIAKPTKDFGLAGYGKPFRFPIDDYTKQTEVADNKVNTIFEKMKENFSDPSNFRFTQLRIPPEAEKWINEKINESITWFAESPAKISKWFSETNAKMSTWYTQNTQKISEWFKNSSESVSKWFNEIPKNMEDAGSKMSTWFNIKKTEISNWAKESSSAMGTFFSELPSKTNIWFGETSSKIKTWLTIKKQELTTWANETGQKIGKFFSSLPNMIWNSITSTFEKIKSWITEKLSFLTNLLSVNKNTTYSNADPRTRLGIPKFATGGIVNRPTYAQIGEDGAEAVVPLEQNTGWIDMLASKLGNNGQPINLTVKIGEDNIISRVIDGINNKSMQMGRGVVMV